MDQHRICPPKLKTIRKELEEHFLWALTVLGLIHTVGDLHLFTVLNVLMD
jgi:hypothetical protein